jgi:AcrR family transcriptional regulator
MEATALKARSTLLAEARRGQVAKKSRRRATARLPHATRRAQILGQAAEFFAANGLTAQTRALADVCGISQRLLYRFFPSKAALIEEVYKSEIAGPFKAVWFAELADRGRPIEERLTAFYRQYYEQVLTERWLRLFLYASLAHVGMAPAYISSIVNHMLDVILTEAVHELGLALPRDPALRHEISWALHGNLSHLAIRRHIYQNLNQPPAAEVISVQVRVFLAGLPAVLSPLRRRPGNRAS